MCLLNLEYIQATVSACVEYAWDVTRCDRFIGYVGEFVLLYLGTDSSGLFKTFDTFFRDVW